MTEQSGAETIVPEMRKKWNSRRTMAFVRWKLLSEAKGIVKKEISNPSKNLDNLMGQMDAWVLEFGGKVFVPLSDWVNNQLTISMSSSLDQIPEKEFSVLRHVLRNYNLITSLKWKDPERCEGENFFRHQCDNPRDFVRNVCGLNSGSRIVAKQDLCLYGYPFFRGDALEIAYDGSKVRCQSFEWDLLVLCQEIRTGECWEIRNN